MLDIRLLRENPDAIKSRLALRDPQLPPLIDAVLECDTRRRTAETQWQQAQAERKRLSKQIGQLRASGQDSSALEAHSKLLATQMEAFQQEIASAGQHQKDLLLRIPNLPHDHAPHGTSADDNQEIRRWGDIRRAQGEDHISIAQRLHLIDFERAAKISGSGFACYTGAGARLQRALIAFMLDLHTTRHGYSEVWPPCLVRRECMEGTGQLPKFEEDMYGLENGAVFLAPTAEVPLTNLHRDEILPASALPIKLTAYTPCFRREAGATGRENRGIIRLHQFDKIELVKICRPEDGPAELESLTQDAEHVLQLLQIPYRVIELCTGDLGFSSMRTYDLEVWSPGQQRWLEVSSCSHFGDFQARRMNLRYKTPEGKNVFCHTLNGSGTALPRLVVALLENHLADDGTITIPPPLVPYLHTDKLT